MLTKKKRRMLKITIPIIITIILIAILVVLYLKTDMFKSDQTLFFKYLGQNSENIKEIQDMVNTDDLDNKIENNKYEENSETTFSYIENYGTTSENTDNLINKLKIQTTGKVDKENNYQYSDIKLLNQDEDSMQMQILESNDMYQITMAELFAQSIEIDNLENLIQTNNNQDNHIEKMQEIIHLEFLNKLKFSEEEIETLRDKYIDLVKVETKQNKFSKKTNQKISINDKQFTANEYTLTMNKEEFNKLYIAILEELKKDKIILNKINTLQEYYNVGLQDIKKLDFEDLFISSIEETIEDINRNNIGTEETKIIVYESKGKTISTIIEMPDYEMDFDNLYNNDEKFSEITFKRNDKEFIKLQISKNNEANKVVISNNKENEYNKLEIAEKDIIEDEGIKRNIIIKYEDETNKIETKYDQKINFVNNVNREEFNEDNIVLDRLEPEQLDIIIKTVNESMFKKFNEITKNVDIKDEAVKILKNIGFVKEAEKITSERNYRNRKK